ncbi:Dehydrodolichyl diphosphate synthase complex subunit SPAC4D7.04c [Cladobotryum mycophilum]|uniref:Dehydrodolichyl diphosphate synthase complex subunit SPAC4D7.04c n=1 Tax=Cladobotryum mycophilum TaxID=491253 RepID=A0ABR0SAL4_9HYPO
MDGNRRFGRRQGITTNDAHLGGFETFIKLMEFGSRLGVKAITVYAFSIDNYNRSEEQVNALMDIIVARKERLIAACQREMVREDVQRCWDEFAERTGKNTKCAVNICFAYTSRMEMAMAVKSTVQGLDNNGTPTDAASPILSDPKSITVDMLERNMYTANDPPLDTVVRSSGIRRLSDFMLWQYHQNTLIFILDYLWPESPLFEAKNMQFIRENTTIPVPEVIQEWSEDGRYFLITKRIPGVPLKEAWPTLSGAERMSIAKQTADYILQLRNLCSDNIRNLGDEPVYSAFLFCNGLRTPHGPFASDDKLWDGMAKALKKVPEKARHLLQQRIPASTPYTFTHADLSTANIIVKDGKLTGIIDWEWGGFLPVWWEYVALRITQDGDDRAWKVMLRQHMEEFTDAQEFWLDFFALARYPSVDERAKGLINDLEEHGV